jgi:hypothetical protein
MHDFDARLISSSRRLSTQAAVQMLFNLPTFQDLGAFAAKGRDAKDAQAEAGHWLHHTVEDTFTTLGVKRNDTQRVYLAYEKGQLIRTVGLLLYSRQALIFWS